MELDTEGWQDRCGKGHNEAEVQCKVDFHFKHDKHSGMSEVGGM
jgi:hypothetical protein